tara:strand:- start:1195 stop:1521 length:327 start_codon:yes stop_codon:yes gene_type:complete
VLVERKPALFSAEHVDRFRSLRGVHSIQHARDPRGGSAWFILTKTNGTQDREELQDALEQAFGDPSEAPQIVIDDKNSFSSTERKQFWLDSLELQTSPRDIRIISSQN